MNQKKEESNFKNIDDALAIIKNLNTKISITFSKSNSPVDNLIGLYSKADSNGPLIEFESNAHDFFQLNDIDHIDFKLQEQIYHSDKLLVTSYSPPHVGAKISNFYTSGFNKNKKYFFQLIIPYKGNFNFHYNIEHYFFEKEPCNTRSVECIRIEYDCLIVDLFLHKESDREINFLVIDCSAKLSFDDFLKYTYSTSISFGYITSNFFQNEGYYFAYEEKDQKSPDYLYYTILRNSMYPQYPPLYASSYGYIKDHKLAEEIFPKLRKMSQKEFSKLCQLTHSSRKFSSILLLIIETLNASLLFMPSGLSVALEGLSDFIVGENLERVLPIRSKDLAKEIKAGLNSIIDNYSEGIDDEGKQILRSRIDNINQLTNKKKLSKPFELINFKLSDKDAEVIEHRNNFLHGRIILVDVDDKNSNSRMFYIAMRLYTLLNILILRMAGYENMIVNYPKIYEDVHGECLDEPFFRQI